MSDQPTNQQEWTREEWEGEGQDDQPRVPTPDDRAHWHKQQWEGEGQDDRPEQRESPAVMGEGDSELSGHGHNPGGGQRWADVDRTEG